MFEVRSRKIEELIKVKLSSLLLKDLKGRAVAERLLGELLSPNDGETDS